MDNDKLKLLRERKGLNITQVASILGIDRSQYGHYENNNITIPIKHLITLCNYYDVSLDYILDFNITTQYKNLNLKTDKLKAGQRLKEFRKEQKLTQEQLANFLNTNKSVVCRYENGTNLIGFSFLYMICDKYKISADYLLGRTDSPKYIQN